MTQTSLAQQILALKAAGADTFVIFATPSPTITALVTATKVGWSPTATFVNNVSANRVFMQLAASNGANLNGVVSTSYLVSPTYAPQANTVGVKLAKAIIGQYAPALLPSLNGGDANVVYGLGAAWTMVYALQHAGKTPTRAGLMKALKSMNNVTDPFLVSGDQAADVGEGQLPDRAGDPDQVDRQRRGRRLGAVRQALQRRSLDTARL